MADFCLIPSKVEQFKKDLKERELRIPDLLSPHMTSEARTAIFAKYATPEDAKAINLVFEKKIVLKNKQLGIENLLSKLGQIGRYDPATIANAKQILEAFKQQQQTRIFNPTQEQTFLNDLADKLSHTKTDLEKANKILELSTKVQQAKTALQADINNLKLEQKYGEAVFDAKEYLNSINPTTKHPISNIVAIPRALVASLDFVSAPFRHGYFSMSDPAWIKNYIQMPKLFVNQNAFRARMGKIYGSKYYDTAIKAGLKVFDVSGNLSKQEEQFATNLLNKFPIVAGSKRSYTGFLNGLRMDQFVSIMKGEELRRGSISPKFAKDMAMAINNLTGAGNLGRFESATPEINLIAFSARMQIARFNMFNPWTYLNPKTDPKARLLMFRGLIGSLAITLTLLGLAQKAGLKVNYTDPTKTDFGEIQIGNLRIDTTGGNRVFINFLARFLTGKYTSAKGKVTQLDVGAYKPLTRKDLTWSFLTAKAAPGAASILADFLNSTQKNKNSPRLDPFGNTIDIQNELKKQLVPLNITNGMDIFEADPTNTALGIVLGLFGLPVAVTKKP